MGRNYRSMRDAIQNGRGVERPFNCPVHGDDNASASVNVVKGVWVCYACRATGKTQEGTHDLSYIPMMLDAEIPQLPPLAVLYTNGWRGYGQYWASRYGVEVATRFATGVDPVDGSPTVPIHNAMGTVVHGFLRRTSAKEGPKYMYPGKVPVSRLLFGHHLLLTPLSVLVLVEGASDVMSLARWQPPRGVGVAGVYGAGVHAAQVDLVKRMGPRHVVVAMDADDAGRSANERSVKALRESSVAAEVHDWHKAHGVRDPGELKDDPWKRLIPASRN
jgi:DNA primase